MSSRSISRRCHQRVLLLLLMLLLLAVCSCVVADNRGGTGSGREGRVDRKNERADRAIATAVPKPCGVFHAPIRLSEAERNTLTHEPALRLRVLRARATELGRNPDIRRNVPTDPLLAPQPKARENTSAAEKQHAKKTKVHISQM